MILNNNNTDLIRKYVNEIYIALANINKILVFDLDDINYILIIISNHFNIRPEDIGERTRVLGYVSARRFFFVFTRALFENLSLSVISTYVQRDHSTVIHGIREFFNLIESRNKEEIKHFNILADQLIRTDEEKQKVISFFREELNKRRKNYDKYFGSSESQRIFARTNDTRQNRP